MANVKITALTNIGSNILYSALIPIVNMTGTPVTQQGNIQILGNYILSGAGSANFAPAYLSNLAYSVVNAAQPNITSVGTLTSLVVTGNITSSSYATANFFVGDGGLLTNVSSAGTSIANGTSNVSIPAAGGNINISRGGTANVLVVSGTGANIAGTLNATGNANVGNLDTSGNITAGYFFGNGSQLTGISATTSFALANGTSNVTIPASSGNVNTSVGGTSNVLVVSGTGVTVTGNTTTTNLNITGNVTSNLLPNANVTYNLGSSTQRWNDIWLANSTIYLGNSAISAGDSNSVVFSGSLQTDGNITANADSNITITTTSGNTAHEWIFGTDGTTTFPTANIDLHNGGVQSGEVLQFGNLNLQSIITGPTPAVDVNAQRLIIQGQRGNGTGEGGDVYLWAGDANTNGGDIKIYAGDADDASAGSGGYVNLAGGDGFDNGGDIDITGGSSANGTGGDIFIDGGSGELDGGTVSIQAGYSANGQGGTVQITGGVSGNGTGSYGNVEIVSGTHAWLFDNTGNLRLPGNAIAINYADGNRVLGNVTFRDEIVIGTGTSNLISGLYLAPSSSSANADMYLRVRGNINDEPTHIHFDTGNNQYYNQYIGDDNKYILLANTGNIVINSNDGVGNSALWIFGNNGNLTLPEGSIVTNNIPLATFDILFQYDDLVWSGNTLTFTNASSTYMLGVLALMEVGDTIILGVTSTTVTGVYTGGGAGTFTVSGTGAGQQIAQFTLPNRLTSVNGIKLTTNSKNYLFTEAGVTQSPVLTVDTLPSSQYAIAGFRAFVSDANLVPVGNFGAIVGNSGSNTVCVWCDGTNWRIG